MTNLKFWIGNDFEIRHSLFLVGYWVVNFFFLSFLISFEIGHSLFYNSNLFKLHKLPFQCFEKAKYMGHLNKQYRYNCQPDIPGDIYNAFNRNVFAIGIPSIKCNARRKADYEERQ